LGKEYAGMLLQHDERGLRPGQNSRIDSPFEVEPPTLDTSPARLCLWASVAERPVVLLPAKAGEHIWLIPKIIFSRE
jgi:hypothetical protein